MRFEVSVPCGEEYRGTDSQEPKGLWLETVYIMNGGIGDISSLSDSLGILLIGEISSMPEE
jgi:hypothetical protein